MQREPCTALAIAALAVAALADVALAVDGFYNAAIARRRAVRRSRATGQHWGRLGRGDAGKLLIHWRGKGGGMLCAAVHVAIHD